MNIFVLSYDPEEAANMHCDKHVVKMIVEYAQLLSTAHRTLDGVPMDNSKINLLLGEYTSKCAVTSKLIIENRLCYKATHANHPCAKWARENDANYYWLVDLLEGCLKQYRHRYNKEHATSKLFSFLKNAPKNIPKFTISQHVQAMPTEYQVQNDPVLAYRKFYIGSKARFAKWTNTPIPPWFARAITSEGYDASNFTRTR